MVKEQSIFQERESCDILIIIKILKGQNEMKKKIQILVVMLMAVVMTGCGGASKDKIEEVQSIYSQLVDRHNEVVEVYADVLDVSLSQKLDEMADKINTIGQQDVKDLSDAQIDEIIIELQENIATYDDILSSIDQITNEEVTDDSYSVSVTIKNNTGIELGSLYLYKASQEDMGENLIENITELGEYETISIVNINMTDDDTLWHLEAIKEDGRVIESADIDLAPYKDGTVTILMEFNFDEMEGWITLE